MKVKVDVDVEFDVEYDADTYMTYEESGDNVSYVKDIEPFCFIRSEGIIIGKMESKEWVTSSPAEVAEEVRHWIDAHYNNDGEDLTIDDEATEVADIPKYKPETEPYTIAASGYEILASGLRSTQDDWWKRKNGRSYNCHAITFDYDEETTEKWDTATDAEKEEWLRCAKEEVDIALRFESGDWQYVTVTVTLGTVTDSISGVQSDDKDWHEGGSELKSMCENVLEQFIEKHS